MGKKNKKKSQKKRQAKALKRRSRKKEIRKSAPKRKGPQIPGLPAGVPPEMAGMAENLMKFAEPLAELAQPESMAEMNALAALTQGFWQTFSETDPEKRESLLAKSRQAYEQQPWATVDFTTLAEHLLKRHIYYQPSAHSEAEQQRYSLEELQAAADNSLTDLRESAAEAAEAARTPVLSGEVEVDQAAEAETQQAAEPFSKTALSSRNIDAREARALLAEKDRQSLTELADYLKTRHQEADFLDPEDIVLQKIEQFERESLDLFASYLGRQKLSESLVKAHLEGLRPFFGEFLKEYHQGSLFSCTAEEVEEYLLDYFIRKIDSTREGEQYLLSGFDLFFTFAEKLGFLADTGTIRERIEDSREEYEEFIRDAN